MRATKPAKATETATQAARPPKLKRSSRSTLKRMASFFFGAVFGVAIVGYYLFLNQDEKIDLQPYVVVPKRAQPAPTVPVAPPSDTLPAIPEPQVSPPPASPASPAEPVPPVSVAPQTEEVPVVSQAAPPSAPLMIPVANVAAAQLHDTYSESRGAGRPHEAIDILAPRGTKVFAVNDGKVVKLFNSVPGGTTLYQFDPTETYAYYYAHLDSYAPGIAEGRQLKRGELIGYVGSTGNASPAAPHLHFAVFELGPQKRWWEGKALNPYPMLAGK
jgi:murein DD-endopeptidase MepM/ murein hydrolase activator NlpD